MNSLYNFFQPQFQQNGSANNLLTQFNQFKSIFNGDPEQQVKQLINSGKMSQEQFNQLAQMANQLRPLIK